jgi:hypothetical protein
MARSRGFRRHHQRRRTLLDPAGLAAMDRRFWWWFYIRGLAALAPRPLRRRLAAWLGEPTPAENEIIAAMWAGIRTYRMEPKFPDVLTDDELRRIRVPALLLTGWRSALISPPRGPGPGRAPAERSGRGGDRRPARPEPEQTEPVGALVNAFIAAASENKARR